MAKKLKLNVGAKAKATESSSAAGGDLGKVIKDSAQEIWLAGLGAYSKAQEEGGKVFEALVKEGVALQKKTQSADEDKISEVTSKMSNMAGGISGKATQHWDKLESIFEDRVAKALNRLGVPASKDVDALVARIDTLAATVAKLSKAPVAKTAAKPVAKRAIRKVAAR